MFRFDLRQRKEKLRHYLLEHREKWISRVDQPKVHHVLLYSSGSQNKGRMTIRVDLEYLVERPYV